MFNPFDPHMQNPTFDLIGLALEKGFSHPYARTVEFLRDLTVYIADQTRGNFVMVLNDQNDRFDFLVKGNHHVLFGASLSNVGFPIEITEFNVNAEQGTQPVTTCLTKEAVIEKVAEILGKLKFVQQRAHAGIGQ